MPVPDLIGRYRVRERLGSGAFATVWLATDEALDSLVAVKVLAENWADHADVRTRFTQEAQIMRRADSDRLVRVFDVGELPDGRPYLVMTYAAGGTLADLLAAGPLPVDVAVRTAADIARGVAVLHAAGVIHRDLKPSNILLRTAAHEALHKAPYEAEHPHVLIADLGLATL
jgi:serine/threonine protein kinase